VPAYGPQNDVTLKMPAFEWVHVQLHQQKGMISLSPPTICNSADLTSPAGKMTMQVISAVAEFERDLLLERTHSGIARAKAAGKRFGRPSILNEEQKLSVIARIKAGASISAIAREFNTTRQTILRVKAGQ
ncbi:helix-turn-helix domain-containing protein, partial [Escherichia coli]|uniref:helix-turn-helix domain-containing protein n=5 Tax=Escherichia coli TaxID=562 RepID=UPI003209BE07